MKPDSTIRALESYISKLERNGETSRDMITMLKNIMSTCETDKEFVDRLYKEMRNENC